MIYKTYADALIEKYHEKVYKLPVSIPVTCPNRDGSKGTSGCTFCGEKGTGFENLSSTLSVQEQLEQNMSYISKKYNAGKFIAYFQSFTNTYLPIENLSSYIDEAAGTENIVEICISTRPDCVSDRYLQLLENKSQQFNIPISIELGLQSSNPHTLKRINRGHSLAQFIDAVIRAHSFSIEVCAHVILNLPWDDETDIEETAKIISALRVEQVKIHSLYIEKDTKLAEQYEKKEFQLITCDEYIDRVILFLELISPQTVVQRLVSRAPAENTIFCNWNMSWWKIRDEILKKMEESGSFQGCKFTYLNNDFYSFNSGQP